MESFEHTKKISRAEAETKQDEDLEFEVRLAFNRDAVWGSRVATALNTRGSWPRGDMENNNEEMIATGTQLAQERINQLRESRRLTPLAGLIEEIIRNRTLSEKISQQSGQKKKNYWIILRTCPRCVCSE